MQKVAALHALTLGHFGPQSVRLVVEDLLKDGTMLFALYL